MPKQILSRVLFLILGCTLILLWLFYGAKRERTHSQPPPLPVPVLPGADLDQDIARQVLGIEAERNQLDQTVYAQELLAEAYEDVFISLWDELRTARDPAESLGNFAFGAIQVGEPAEPALVEHGIRVTRLSGPGRALNPAAWQEWIRNLKHDGYQLVQSEWRHAQFVPGREGTARSVFAIALHVANPERKERWVVRGNLGVHWRTSLHRQPFPERLDATSLEWLARTGETIFERILEKPISTDLHPDLIDPLILHDLNGDRLPEILLVGQNLVYWNRGDGRFEPGPLCQQPVAGLNTAVLADFTGDGLVDLMGADNEALILFRGEERGSFRTAPQRISFTPVELANPFVMTAGDVDGDGDLDLWLGQYKPPYVAGQMPTPYFDANDGFPAFLLLNDGQGGFLDATAQSGLSPKRFRRTYSASFVDLDDDGDLDLLVVSDFAGVDLYYNDGHGHFTDVTARVLDQTHAFGMAHALGDFDRNGLVDLLVIGMNSYTAERLDHLGLGSPESPEHQFMRPKMAYGNRLFLQDNGAWRHGPLSDQVARSGWSWGVSSFDSDNDGALDLYIANGHKSRRSAKDYASQFWRHDIYAANSTHDPALDTYFRSAASRLYGLGRSYGGYEKNRLFLNQAGQSFLEIGFLAGVSMEEDCRNVVADDLDGDGRLDLLVTTYESWPRERRSLHVFRNRIEPAGNWLGLHLRGGGRGCSPVGAKITLTTAAGQQIRHLITGDSYRSQHSNTAHFGLGLVTRVDAVEVRWPNGHRQRLPAPAINRYHLVTCDWPAG